MYNRRKIIEDKDLNMVVRDNTKLSKLDENIIL